MGLADDFTAKNIDDGEGVIVQIGNGDWMKVYRSGAVENSIGTLCKPSYGHTTLFPYLKENYNWRVKSTGGHCTCSIAKLLCEAFYPAPRPIVRIEITGNPKDIPTADTVKPFYDGEPFHTLQECEEKNTFYRQLGRKMNNKKFSDTPLMPEEQSL